MLKKKQKETTLAKQIGKVVLLVLVIVFSALIIITTLMTSSSLTKAIDNGVSMNSKKTAQQIQNIITTAVNAVTDINTYLEKAYDLEEKGFANMAGETASNKNNRKNKSLVYENVEISELNSDVEKYITETARTVVMSNDAIAGIGIMFQPFKYAANIESYAFYVSDKTGKDGEIKPFGKYTDYCKNAYYKDAYETGKAVFTDPYEYEGNMIITYSIPIIFKDEVQGIIMADINTGTFGDAMEKDATYPSMYTALYNSKGMDIFDSETADDVGHLMDEFFVHKEELQTVKDSMSKGAAFSTETVREDKRKISRYYTPFTAGGETWWSMTALDTVEKNQATTRTIGILFVVTIVFLCIIVIMVIQILNKKIKPIQKIVNAANQIAEGKLDIEIIVDTNDEIGQLTKAFRGTAERLRNIIEDENYLLKEMAAGNFNVSTSKEEYYKGEFRDILTSITNMKQNLNQRLSQMMNEILETSERVSVGSNSLSETSQSLAEGATEQACAVQELLATMESLDEGVTHTAKQVDSAYVMAHEYAAQANASNEEMNGLVNTMSRINEISKQIGSIIGEIESIASQTNLLSLNASIEAARAGEAGKGFAVVADQIGKLAEESAQSAVNTRELITKAINEIESGTQAVSKTSVTLNEVVDGIKQVAEAAKEVSSLSQTQAESVKQVEVGINQISDVIQSNSATAEESSATSEELSEEAASLAELVKQFQLID